MRLPEARTPDPRCAPAIRWGILAPGGIAHTFAQAVALGPSTVVAVGSRSADRAQAFANEFGIKRAHGSYEALVADPDVDAIYVASPHSEHREHALLAIGAGKPVLVEKAFVRNAIEAREVFAAAARGGLLVAEAMWSRYLPHYDVVRQAIDSGLIGEVALVTADHSQPLYPGGPERLEAPELAGGALLDLGVYPISFADFVLAAPTSVTARGRLTDRGVDHTVGILLEAQSGSDPGSESGPGSETTGLGAEAALTTSMHGLGPVTAVVIGTKGRLELDGWFYTPTTVRLVAPDGTVLDERPGVLPDGVIGFSYETAEFARCLAAGVTESPVMPHAATLRVMETMDEIRAQIGVVYPGE